MSLWGLTQVEIKDMAVFQEVCKKHNILCTMGMSEKPFRGMAVIAHFKDNQTSGYGYLVKDPEGKIKMAMDTDPRYNPMLRRLGGNTENFKLGRDYSEMVTRKELMRGGGMVVSSQEQSDGSLILRVAI